MAKRVRDKRYADSKKTDAYLWLRHNLKAKRYQAKKLGLVFDLDEDWLKKQPMQCAITGQPFVIIGPQTPSFDQKVAGAGYSKENTQLICFWVNAAKGKWPEDQIRALIREAGKVV